MIVSGEKIELYDIGNDPGESKNLAKEYPEVVTELKKKGDQYQSQTVLYK